MKTSCGIIPFRKNGKEVEFLLGHPGGESWTKREFWTMFKGCKQSGEDNKETAIREFTEETGYNLTDTEKNAIFFVGRTIQNKSKEVYAYALYCPKIDEKECFSNLCDDGSTPEIDEYKWMLFSEVSEKTHTTHVKFYETIVNIVCDGKHN